MGVNGLLPLLKSIQQPCNLKKFSGQTIGVDAYGWLHRGTIACAIDLALGRPTTKYVDFAMNRVRMLQYFGVTPYIVFDGDYLPSKAGTEAARSTRREESRKTGLEMYNMGRIAQAQQELQKAIDVTPLMARHFIEELKRVGVQYVVAPYEADAQLAYLERKGIINGILSEDSDLLVFGAKRLLTKLDQHGECVEINRSNFTSCREVSLVGWSDTDFRRMAIFSGCDYLANINKMGLKTAYRYVRKYKSPEKIIRMLEFEGQYCVPRGYAEKYKEAELTFLHHRVFCPIAKKLVFLTELGPETKEENLPFIGIGYSDDIAVGVACGDLDPMTKKPLIIEPQKRNASQISRSRPMPERRITMGTPADLKAKKPIDSFFTPRRTPLAELDPNSMTPSPTQQRLLERHASASWSASPAPGSASSARTTSLVAPNSRNVRYSTGSNVSMSTPERTAFLSRAATMSSYQPVKRQRLCSEVDEIMKVASKPPATDDTSRFFPQKAEVKARRESSNRRQSGFSIHTDEGIDSMLSELPNGTDEMKPTKISVFKEELPKSTASYEIEVSTPDATSQVSASSQSDVPSSASHSLSAPSTDSQRSVAFSADADDDSFEAAVADHIKISNARLRQRFAYQSSAESVCSVDSSPVVSPAVGTAKPLPKLLRTTSSRPLSQTRAAPMSTLQRLGQTALSRSKSMEGFTFRVPSESPHASRSQTPANMTQDETQCVKPVAAAKARGPVTLGMGSEDMIVPDSEDEDGDVSSPEPEPTTSLDLGKFAFAAGR